MDSRLETALKLGFWTPVPGRDPWLVPILVPRKIDERALDVMLDCLTCLDEMYLLRYPDTPWLYSSGLRYEREPIGQEQWLTIPWMFLRRDQGRGVDCEDLSCYRAAELRVRRGERAKAIHVHKTHPNGGRLYHIRCKHADGRVEDPSHALGMGREWAQFFGPIHGIVDGEKVL